MFGAVRRAQQRGGEGSAGYKGPDAFQQQEAPRPLSERDPQQEVPDRILPAMPEFGVPESLVRRAA
jgi:hypothetical protein